MQPPTQAPSSTSPPPPPLTQFPHLTTFTSLSTPTSLPEFWTIVCVHSRSSEAAVAPCTCYNSNQIDPHLQLNFSQRYVVTFVHIFGTNCTTVFQIIAPSIRKVDLNIKIVEICPTLCPFDTSVPLAHNCFLSIDQIHIKFENRLAHQCEKLRSGVDFLLLHIENLNSD